MQDGGWRPSWNDGTVAHNPCVSWAFLLLIRQVVVPRRLLMSAVVNTKNTRLICSTYGLHILGCSRFKISNSENLITTEFHNPTIKTNFICSSLLWNLFFFTTLKTKTLHLHDQQLFTLYVICREFLAANGKQNWLLYPIYMCCFTSCCSKILVLCYNILLFSISVNSEYTCTLQCTMVKLRTEPMFSVYIFTQVFANRNVISFSVTQCSNYLESRYHNGKNKTIGSATQKYRIFLAVNSATVKPLISAAINFGD